VARIRRNANPGLGLRWERAGSTGDADDLAKALELLFAVPASSFTPSIVSGTGRIRTTYLFPRQPAVPANGGGDPANGMAAPISNDAAPHSPIYGSGRGNGVPGLPPLKIRRLDDISEPPHLGKPDAGPIGLSVTDQELDELDVKVYHGSQSRQGRSFKRAFDVDSGIVEPTPLANGRMPTPVPGELTATRARPASDDDDDEIRHRTARFNRRAPVRFEGVMTAARIDVPVLITGLGSASLFVETTLAPLDRAARVGLRIDVRVRDGVRKFWLNCALERIHEGEYGTPPGVELKILAFDEPQQRDEFARLVEAARQGLK